MKNWTPHNLSARIAQVKKWGLVGVLNHFRRRYAEQRLRRFFVENAERFPENPQSGITLIADMTGTGSLSKVMRDLATRLRDSQIPYQTYDLHEGAITIPETDYQTLLTPLNDFHILRYSHVLEMCTHVLPTCIPVKHARIYFWEFDSGLLEYDASLAQPGSVVAMSDFNQDVFRNILPSETTVQKILYPFLFNVKDIPSQTESRSAYGLKEDEFVVFFNFDFNTSYQRKNPEDMLRAFATAFKSEPKARLVFKTNNAKRHPEKLLALNSLAEQLGVINRIKIITEYLSTRELYGLTNACDVYISLHRGEGFGLGIAEAMYLGKAVVATGYSAPTEFCKNTHSIVIPYSLVEPKFGDIDNPCYSAVKHWAQPDVSAAATALRNLFENPTQCAKLGAAAKAFIESHFSANNFKSSLQNFLKS